MVILVPLRSLILVWGVLSGLVFVGFLGSSLFERKAPFAIDRGLGRQTVVKQDAPRATPGNQASLRSFFSASPVGLSVNTERKTRSPAIQKLLTRTSCK